MGMEQTPAPLILCI